MTKASENSPLINEFVNIFVQYQTVHFLKFLYDIELSSAQINILIILNLFKEMSIKELSEFTKTSLPAASQMISRMEKDGYVIKESVKDPSLHQNRKKVLHLSEKGLDIIKKSSESRNLFFDSMKKLYSDDEYAVTEEAIQIFLEKFKQHSNGLEFILNK